MTAQTIGASTSWNASWVWPLLTETRGSFAACFSSTGEFLAVGTQYGTISIFHVPSLTHPQANPLITSFNSSRSNAEFGAVRDMAFSPGPYDLLAWTEDRGRVGVADVRKCFDSRQILHLDKDEDFEVLSVSDRGTIDPRLLDQRSERNEALLATFATALENRRSDGQSLLARYNVPLSSEETAVLEAIQDYRRRQEQYGTSGRTRGTDAGDASGASNNGGSGSGGTRPPPWSERTTRASGSGENDGSRQRTASVSRAVNDVLDSIRSQRERMRENQARQRAVAAAAREIRETREDNALADRRRYAPHILYGIGTPPLSAGGATRGGGGGGSGTSGSGSGGANSSTSGSGGGVAAGGPSVGAMISRLMANVTSAAAGGGSGSGSSGSSTTAVPAGGWDNVEALYG